MTIHQIGIPGLAVASEQYFATQADAEVYKIPGNVSGVNLAGVRYIRYVSEPPHDLKFRDAARYLPNGVISAGNGGWWGFDFVRNCSFRPVQFGAIGDGVTDDIVAINAMWTAVRAKITADSAVGSTLPAIGIRVDMSGGVYRITDTINATGMYANGMEACGGIILAECTGKPAWDWVGTRCVHWHDATILGSKTSQPTKAVQIARSVENGFCDQNNWNNITTAGWFSEVSAHVYGMEDSGVKHCNFWNSVPTGALLWAEGNSDHTMTSAFQTVVSGEVSFIHNKWDNLNCRHTIYDDRFLVTGITKANPGVVTAPGHNFQNGDQIMGWLIGGMTELNARVCTVANRTSTTFELSGLNTTGFGTFTSGGYVVKKTVDPVKFSRMEGQTFSECYLASWADHAITIKLGVLRTPKQLHLDWLCEGGFTSQYHFATGTTVGEIRGLTIFAYNTFLRGSFLSTDASGGGAVKIFNGDISVANHEVNTTLPLVDDATKYYFNSGTEVLYPREDGLDADNLASFYGKFKNVQNSNEYLWRPFVAGLLDISRANAGQIKFPVAQNASSDVNTLDDYEEGTFTPVVIGTSAAGAGTYSLQSGRYTKIGNRVFFDIALTWSAHTGTGDIRLTGLPFTAAGTLTSWLNIALQNFTYSGDIKARVNGSATTIEIFSQTSAAAVVGVALDTAASVFISGSYPV